MLNKRFNPTQNRTTEDRGQKGFTVPVTPVSPQQTQVPGKINEGVSIPVTPKAQTGEGANSDKGSGNSQKQESKS